MKTGDRIQVRDLSSTRGGTIKQVHEKNDKVTGVSILLDSTTTGVLSKYTKRKDGNFVLQGYSMDDAAFGGWFRGEVSHG